MGVENKPNINLPSSRIFMNGRYEYTPDGSSFQAIFINRLFLNTPKPIGKEISPERRKQIEEDIAQRCQTLGITEEQIEHCRAEFVKRIDERDEEIKEKYPITKR